MAISSTSNSVSYNGNGSTSTPYTIPFVFQSPSDIIVQLGVGGVFTTLVNGTDYTLTTVSSGVNITGSITTTVAYSGNTVFIERQIPATQPYSYLEGGAFPAQSQETALDRLTMLFQQTLTSLQKCFRFSDSATANLPSVPDAPSSGAYSFGVNGGVYGWLPPSLTTATPPTAIIATGSTSSRLLTDRAADVVNVKDFGAVGNGASDDTTAINLAIAAATGKKVYFPSGTYLVSSTITVTHSVVLVGSGMWTTLIKRTGDFGDTFFFTGNDGSGTSLTDVSISDLKIQSFGLTTSGAHLHINGVNRIRISNVYMQDGYIGLWASSATIAYIDNFRILFTNLFTGSATGRRFALFDSNASYAHASCGDVFISNFSFRGTGSANNTEIGVYIKSADGLWFSNGYVCGTSSSNITLSSEIAGTGNQVGLVFFDNVMSDECLGAGVSFLGNSNTGRDIKFSNCTFKGNGQALYGILANANATFIEVQFSNCTVSEYLNEGINLASSGCQEFGFYDMQVRGNSYGNPGAYNNVSISDGGKIQFIGGTYGGKNVVPFGTNDAAYAFGISSGADTNIMIIGVDATNNYTGSFNISGGIRNNVYVNDCLSQNANTIASATNIDLPVAFSTTIITGNTLISNITAQKDYTTVTLIFTSTGSNSNNALGTGGNIILNGAFPTTKPLAANSSITLTYDVIASKWLEISRSQF